MYKKNYYYLLALTFVMVGTSYTVGTSCIKTSQKKPQALPNKLNLSPATLQKHLPPLEAQQKEIILKWRDKNVLLLKDLNAITSFRNDQKETGHKNKVLKGYGLKNEGTSNFIFRIPGSDYVAKIASTANKRFNYATADDATVTKADGLASKLQNLKEGTPEYKKTMQEWNHFWDEQYKKYVKNKIPFYQGISRIERYILLKQAIAEKHLDAIQVADAHLIPFKEGEQRPVSDQTYFVIQKIVPNAKPLDVTSPAFKALPVKTIIQLLQAIQAGYLWDSPEAYIDIKSDGKTLVLRNLEQPNRFAPADAFLKNKRRYEIFTLQGITQLLDVLKKYGTKDQYDAAIEFIKKDNNLHKFDEFNNRLSKYFNKK